MKLIALGIKWLIGLASMLPYSWSSKVQGFLGALYVMAGGELKLTGQGQAAKDAEAAQQATEIEIKVMNSKRATIATEADKRNEPL